MKTNLKILYKTPDLDAMAEKHQDFDALMDAVTDEKIRRRKKLYRFSSFAIVIVATAFLSWLYWGYEPASSETAPSPQEATQPVVKEERKEPVVEEAKEEPVQQPEATPTVEKEEEKPAEQNNAVTTETAADKEEEPDEEELALPQVTMTQKISMDAEPVDGLENLYRYLYKEINLPDSLLQDSNTLFLEVEFTVEKNGDISQITLSKTLPQAVDSALKNIFAGMPAWKPALEANDSVASVVNLPITFQKKEKDQ